MFVTAQLRQALQGVSPEFRALSRGLSHASAQLLSSEAPLPTDVYVQVGRVVHQAAQPISAGPAHASNRSCKA